jgi:hypothetical protein
VKEVHVGADRLERWVHGFGERHPGVQTLAHADRVEFLAPDGSTAILYPSFEPLLLPDQRPDGGRVDAANSTDSDPPARADLATLATALVDNANSVPVLRAVLIRRGGYACAVVSQDRVTASKVGSRYVQGRTAAGGWSQHRFARRRDGQVHALIDSATEVAVRILLPTSPGDGLVTGGDKPLIERVLADPRLRPLRLLRRGPHLEIGDPKIDLVKALSERARAIRIALEEH